MFDSSDSGSRQTWFREDDDLATIDSVSFITEVSRATLPTFSLDEIALQLTEGYWGGTARSFDVVPGGTLTVNLTALSTDGRYFAVAALEAWTMVSGINFSVIAGLADITFGDSDVSGGAYAGSNRSGSTILSSYVEIERNWILGDEGNLNSYSFQTYMHEIGHALGLGHAGNYNVSAVYAEDGTGDNHYLSDSWQMTLMSYFSQDVENTWVNASYAFTATPMIADIIAIQNLYGTAGNLRVGNTTYGENSNAGEYYDTLDFSNMTFTIIDDGGIDWINFGSETAGMVVNLAAEAISSIGGLTGNMIIARGTIIENFAAGPGDDFIDGNDANNTIKGGAGEDLIRGLGGNDIVKGFSGGDVLNGNGNHDELMGSHGNDILRGGAGRDVIWGGGGDDTITGGIGRDKLIGGNGADTFVFKSGHNRDRIRDFEDDIDTLHLDEDLWAGVLTATQVVNTYGSVNATTGFVELDFGGGNVIVFQDIADKSILIDDIIFI